MTYHIATKGAFVGRGKGATSVYHAIPGEQVNGGDMQKAICGAQPGSRSYGWLCDSERDITCPKCLKKKEATQ